jgi:hypothetical protein
MSDLHPCPECERHVRSSDVKCPFCRATIDARSPDRRAGRLSRAAAFAGAALLGVACGGSDEEVEGTDDTVEDTGGEVTDDGTGDEVTDDGDSDEIQAMPYGAPPRRDRLV